MLFRTRHNQTAQHPPLRRLAASPNVSLRLGCPLFLPLSSCRTLQASNMWNTAYNGVRSDVAGNTALLQGLQSNCLQQQDLHKRELNGNKQDLHNSTLRHHAIPRTAILHGNQKKYDWMVYSLICSLTTLAKFGFHSKLPSGHYLPTPATQNGQQQRFKQQPTSKTKAWSTFPQYRKGSFPWLKVELNAKPKFRGTSRLRRAGGNAIQCEKR